MDKYLFQNEWELKKMELGFFTINAESNYFRRVNITRKIFVRPPFGSENFQVDTIYKKIM